MTENEIKLEVLKIAHSDCFSRYIEALNNSRLDSAESTIDNEQLDALFPKSQDIINRATELYEFINTKN
jgi:hypothetical protein